jgi:recombination protein RecR
MSRLLDGVTRELAKLPGIGKRTALRLSMHILRADESDVAQMVQAIADFRTGIRYCARCNNLSDNEFCDICCDASRDEGTICVVEQVGDVMSIEKTGQFHGLYHVLGGVISPMSGIAPSDLKIDLLIDNIAKGGVSEVILAISTTVEGETTLFYIMNRLKQFPELRITSIARGIGFGDEIEYADELTVSHAIRNRREVER